MLNLKRLQLTVMFSITGIRGKAKRHGEVKRQKRRSNARCEKGQRTQSTTSESTEGSAKEFGGDRQGNQTKGACILEGCFGLNIPG